MEGLLSLLLFGVFFYFMMRFGCGAHMVHGHGGHAGHGTTESRSKDPVCGMDVPAGAGYSMMYEGHRYQFCSRKCLDQFEAEPRRYAIEKGAQ